MFNHATHRGRRTGSARRTISIAIATVLVAIAGMTLSSSVAASHSDEGVQGCTLATLKGRYLFADAGTLLPPAVAQPTLTAWAGFHVFNGDGTGHDIVTGRFDGQIMLENVVSPISYSVNADCTGSLTVAGGPTFGLFIAPDGDSIASITTDPGGAGASVHQRVSRR